MESKKDASKKEARPLSARKQEMAELTDHIRYLQDLKKELKDRSPEKIRKVKALVALVPEGRYLLRMARKLRVDIKWGRGMEDGLRGATSPKNPDYERDKEGNIIIANRPRYQIELDSQQMLEDLAVTLAHELRHVWQNTQLEQGRIVNMSPRLGVAYNRVLEGDARAFHTQFEKKLMAKLEGKKGEDMSPADWKKAFDSFQTSEDARDYDKGSVEGAARTIGMIKQKVPAPHRQHVLSELFNQSAAKTLRKLDKILVTGFSKKSKPYYNYGTEDRLANAMVRTAPKRTQAKIAKIEKTIRTGK